MTCVPDGTPSVGETAVCPHVYCVALTVVTARAVADAGVRLLASQIVNLGSRHVPALSVVALCLSGYR